MLDRLLSRYSTTIDFREFFFHLGLTAVLCFWLSLLFVLTAEKRRPAMRLARFLPFIGMIMALMSTVIASSLAIAIGMVGAVSVVRYRAVLPEIEHLVFVFLAIACGLACGIGQVATASVGLLVIAAVLIGRYIFERRQKPELAVQISGKPGAVEAILPVLQESFPEMELRQLHESADQADWHFSFQPNHLEELLELRQVLNREKNLKIILKDESPA